MFTTSDSGSNEMVEMLDDMAELDADQAMPRRSPSGLLQALVRASSKVEPGRVLPTVDAADVGSAACLFDYERDLAVDFHGDLPLV